MGTVRDTATLTFVFVEDRADGALLFFDLRSFSFKLFMVTRANLKFGRTCPAEVANIINYLWTVVRTSSSGEHARPRNIYNKAATHMHECLKFPRRGLQMYTLRCSAFITCVVIALFGTNAFHIHVVSLVHSGQVLGLSLGIAL